MEKEEEEEEEEEVKEEGRKVRRNGRVRSFFLTACSKSRYRN